MRITAQNYKLITRKAELLVAGSFDSPTNTIKEIKKIDSEMAEQAKGAVSKKRFSGNTDDRFSTYNQNFKVANELNLLGLGKRSAWTAQKLRNCIASIYHVAKSSHAKSVRVLAETFVGGSVTMADVFNSIPEIMDLADYQFNRHKFKVKKKGHVGVQSIEILISRTSLKRDATNRIKRARVIAESVNLARTLINEPANIMSPRQMAQEARKVAKEGKLKCQVLGLNELKRLKMGGIIGVAQGSYEPPQLIILEYGVSHKNRGTICLVGKGVCFDTGGISIKPSANMEKMKYDMSGAAAVIGTMHAISRLKLKVHVVGITPCVENMPGGGAQRPGDIVKMFNGKSVEVLNTDAEGRLILADALAYTKRFEPDAIIDLATLTGAVAVALGDKAIGVLGTDSALMSRVKKSGEKTGERCWELPLWDEYFHSIKGHHSDILNIGSGGAGTITAAMFLKQFVPIKSWVHMDIASTAWADRNKPYNVRGATGVGVRLLVDFIQNWAH